MEVILNKMKSVHNDIVDYYITDIHLNELIGSKIKIDFTGQIFCIKCGNKTPKSFAQGFCYKCFISAPEAEECVLKPELCRAHEGTARDMNYATENCLQEHVVYLALASCVKVGVTRKTQVPTRWIDQGASKAIKLATTPNRYTAGIIEVELKKYLADKTNWQKMLKNEIDEKINLIDEKSRIAELIPQFSKFIHYDNFIYNFSYPVNKYPVKVKSMNLDDNPKIEGVLSGIKGQYLIFEDNSVVNIRKYGGYKVNFEF